MILFFIVPSGFSFFRYCHKNGTKPLPKGETSGLLTWNFVVKRIPWGLIYLIGAGTALNEGMKTSGLDKQLSGMLSHIKSWPYEAQIIIIIMISAVMSQAFVSIVALNTLLTFLLPLSTKLTVHPLRICLPAGLVATGAYLLPVSGASIGMVTALGNIKSQDVLLFGLCPWLLTMFSVYIHSISWMRVVYSDYVNYPPGLKGNWSSHEG